MPMQLFNEAGCPENIVDFNNKKFVEEVTERLYIRLKADIRQEMEEVLGE